MKWKCNRCGKCCHSPRLYKKDRDRIKKAGWKEEDFVYVDDLGNKYTKELKNYCMFLKRNKGKSSCITYHARPDICRQYPSELDKDGDCRPKEMKWEKTIVK